MKKIALVLSILLIINSIFVCYAETIENIQSEIKGKNNEENVIYEVEENDIASESDATLLTNNVNMPRFGAGNNVYWYLKNSNTELHLSGTVPTDSAYVTGNDNYPIGFFSDKTLITKVVIDDEICPIDCYNWFKGFQNLTNIENISLLNTSNTIYMSYMFQECENLTSLDLSTFDTQNVTEMNFMFYLCSNLSSLNISSFNTEKVTNMDDMFYDCYSLTTLDISSFDTSSLTSAYSMFANSGLQRIYASPLFNISSSVLSIQMFYGCTSLEGENGITYDPAHVDGTYARIDTATTPGYFTRKQLTVSYDTDGGTSIAPSVAYCGYTISEPATPTKSGYTLENWYKESSHIHVWNFASDVVKKDMILYAKWERIKHTVSFDTDGGTSISDIEVNDGDTFTAPSTPTKTGYAFVNWYKESSHIYVWNFASDVVIDDMILYAKWERIKHTVSFDTDGGTSIPDIEVNDRDTFTAPTTPTKSGYTFENWYKESSHIYVWNFASDVVTSDMTLYAKWEENGGESSGGSSSGGGGSSGGTPKTDGDGEIIGPSGEEETKIIPSDNSVIGLEGITIWNIQYLTLYSWDYTGEIAKNSNIKYNLNDAKFYKYDGTVVSNEWVGLSFYNGKILWYYTKNDGTVYKDISLQIGMFIYHFDKTGRMCTGYTTIDGKVYYFSELNGIAEGILLYS